MKSDIQEEQNFYFCGEMFGTKILEVVFMLVKHMPLLHDIGCQDVRKGFQLLYKYNSSQLAGQHKKYPRMELYQ